MPEPLIPTHRGYRNMKGFQVAQLVCDLTLLAMACPLLERERLDHTSFK